MIAVYPKAAINNLQTSFHRSFRTTLPCKTNSLIMISHDYDLSSVWKYNRSGSRSLFHLSRLPINEQLICPYQILGTPLLKSIFSPLPDCCPAKHILCPNFALVWAAVHVRPFKEFRLDVDAWNLLRKFYIVCSDLTWSIRKIGLLLAKRLFHTSLHRLYQRVHPSNSTVTELYFWS